MIYDRTNIIVPELCVLQFSEPTETEYYPEQYKYMPEILTLGSCIQIMISETLYTSGNLILKAINCDGHKIGEYSFTKCKLSDGFYYAQTMIDFISINEDSVAKFEIWNYNTKLADTVWYKIFPSYTDNVKKILFSHSDNDYNVVFNEDCSELYLSVFEYFSIVDGNDCIFCEIKLSKVAENYVIHFVTDERPEYVEDFTIYFNDENGNYHTETVTTNHEKLEYTVTIPKTILEEHNTNIIIMTVVDNKIISRMDTSYLFGDTFTRTNEFYFDIECGFIPSDSRIEQEIEDFIDQELSNELVYGDEYEVMPLTIGTGTGISNWMRNKFSRASICDTFEVESTQYKRAQGAKMEKVEETSKGLGVYKIDLQKTKNYIQ